MGNSTAEKTAPHSPLDDEKFIPKLDLSAPSLISCARDYLTACEERMRELIEKNISPLHVHRIRSLMIDRLILAVFYKFQREFAQSGFDPATSCSLMATGGYGRREMSLLSDIDLLLIHNTGARKEVKSFIEKMLYVLWDLSLDVGHAVRTLASCRKIMRDDHTVLTAMLDLRLLAGRADDFNDLIYDRTRLFKNRSFRKKFMQAKVAERSARLKKFGGSVYLLEPHIKEGEGGLRDLHLIRWLAQIMGMKGSFQGLEKAGYFGSEVRLALESALEFFLNLRNRLHLFSHKRTDQLNFEAQIRLAAALGFQDRTDSLGVEKFMQSVYAATGQVDDSLNMFIQKVSSQQSSRWDRLLSLIKTRRLDAYFKIRDGKIHASPGSSFAANPARLMSAFEWVQKTGADLHFATREQITGSLPRMDESFRNDPEVCRIFRTMMANYRHLGRALFAMHETHFFDALIPEFRTVRHRMQHDVYHVYTVDTHSLFAIEELSLLEADDAYAREFPGYRKAMQEVEKKDLLGLGLLFHDIGKGKGKNHSVIGAKMARNIMTRFGYADADIAVVEFLVLSHLLMPHLSQRRDLEDASMIREFAHSMQTADRLNMLYVLTWADIRAVSREAWTSWKGHLLQTLYEKTRVALTTQSNMEDQVKRRVADVRNALLGRIRTKIGGDLINTFLVSISPRYVLSNTDEEIISHFNMISSFGGDQFFFQEKETENGLFSEVFIYTLNNPRVLPLVTGAMLSLDVNIFTMENFTLKDGHVLIKMHVQSQGGQSLKRAGQDDSLKDALKSVFEGKHRVQELIARRKKPVFLQKKTIQRAKTRVHIDNDVSAYYTVIDIYTHDRVGLLYDIIECLIGKGCYVEVSKISTKVDQVVDTFYVQDIFGHKILHQSKLNEVRQALYDVIEGQKQAGVSQVL